MYAGFQPSLVAVVWMGYDTPRSLGARESGGGLSLPVWIDFMGQALRGIPVASPAAPDDVLKVGGDWVYADWALGGAKTHLGFDDATEALGALGAPSAPASGPTLKPAEPPLPGSVMGPN